MLDAKDIQVLRDMFAENGVQMDQKFTVFRDEILEKVGIQLHAELYKVRNDIIDVINGVLPQIDGLDRRVHRLERWARIA